MFYAYANGICKKCGDVIIKDSSKVNYCINCGSDDSKELTLYERRVIEDINDIVERYIDEEKMEEALKTIKLNRDLIANILYSVNMNSGYEIVDKIEVNVKELQKWKHIIDRHVVEALSGLLHLEIDDFVGHDLISKPQRYQCTLGDILNLEELQSFYPTLCVDADENTVTELRTIVKGIESDFNKGKSASEKIMRLNENAVVTLSVMVYNKNIPADQLNRDYKGLRLLSDLGIMDVYSLSREIKEMLSKNEERCKEYFLRRDKFIEYLPKVSERRSYTIHPPIIDRSELIQRGVLYENYRDEDQYNEAIDIVKRERLNLLREFLSYQGYWVVKDGDNLRVFASKDEFQESKNYPERFQYIR